MKRARNVIAALLIAAIPSCLFGQIVGNPPPKAGLLTVFKLTSGAEADWDVAVVNKDGLPVSEPLAFHVDADKKSCAVSYPEKAAIIVTAAEVIKEGEEVKPKLWSFAYMNGDAVRPNPTPDPSPEPQPQPKPDPNAGYTEIVKQLNAEQLAGLKKVITAVQSVKPQVKTGSAFTNYFRQTANAYMSTVPLPLMDQLKVLLVKETVESTYEEVEKLKAAAEKASPAVSSIPSQEASHVVE